MAMVALPGGVNFPQPQIWSSGQMTLLSKTIDASGEKYAMVFEAPRGGVLHGFEFCLTSSTQVATSGLRLSFRNLEAATNLPDMTTTLAYRVVTSGIASSAWITSGIMTSDGTDGGVPLTVSRGQKICCVVEFESFQSGDTIKIWSMLASYASNIYTALYTTSWAVTTTDTPITALKYQDGTYPMLTGGIYPQVAGGVASASYGSASNPDEVGMTFAFPTDVLIGGAWIRCDLDVDANLCLYDSQSNLITSKLLDKDHRSSTNGGLIETFFDRDYRIAANEIYRLTLQPTSSSIVTLYVYIVNAIEMLDLLAGGSSWQRTERVNAGAFSEPALQRPWMGVRITGIEQEIGGQPSIGFEGDA